MIDSGEKLVAYLPRLRAAEWVALDTEADSLHAYPEKLCLVQISLPNYDTLVDPLAGLDLSALWETLSGRELIMHGADYDLRLLRKTNGFVPKRIFDTMIAARLLGRAKFSLSDLVSGCLGVALEKGPQKANWARRPLTRQMETYAVNDTHYLKPVAEILGAELREKGRLSWHEETCARLIEECSLLRVPDAGLVWRIKGSFRLNPHALAVLRELWHWREKEALARNQPPYFVLSPERMVALAAAAAQSPSVEPHLPRHLAEPHKQTLREVITRARSIPPSNHPELLRPAGIRITHEQKRNYHALERHRNRQAALLGIDPTLIGSRATLIALAIDWNAHQHELMRWQRELLKMERK